MNDVPRGVRAAGAFRWILVAALGAAAVVSIASWLAARHAAGPAATTIYHCPMHPSVRQDHPGECPICGMTLVPETGTAGPRAPASGPGSVPGLMPVVIGPDRQQLGGVTTAPVRRAKLAATIRTVGTVAANERGMAQVESRFAGWIQTLEVAETGQKVARGQILATLYSPDLFEAQQELVNALRWDPASGAPPPGGHGAASHDFDAQLLGGLKKDARTRLELLGVAPEDADVIEKTGRPIRELRLRSPVAGHVIQKNAVRGAYIQPGMALFSIADLSTVWVWADVYERDLRRVHEGETATLTLGAYPGESFAGKVTFLAPTVDPATRTMRVRVELANPKLRLRPGMAGDVTLEPDDGADALVVPAAAVVDTGEVQYVFVALGGGRFEPRRVRTGTRAGDDAEILDGVADGETVVTTAAFLVDSESRLRAAVEGR